MNRKIKLVLLFAKFRKPITVDNVGSIAALRKKSDRAAALGSFLYDKKIPVQFIQDTSADGVPVRIYKNSDAPNQRVIVYYHGGGFVLYGRYSHDYVCRRLCSMNNCIVVSVDYRLAPEFTFPAAHEDAFKALQWVRQHISEYGGDGQNLVVAGDSAGGNLAACMAHRCREENIPLRAQVLVYPWIDGALNNPSLTTNGSGYLLEKETVFWFREQYTPKPEERCLPRLSPCYEKDFTALAPAMVITAGLDPLLDDGRKYAAQLQQHGVTCKHYNYEGLYHGFFNTPLVHDSALQAYRDIQQFLLTV